MTTTELTTALDRMMSQSLGLWGHPPTVRHLYRTTDNTLHSAEIETPPFPEMQNPDTIIQMLLHLMKNTEVRMRPLRESVTPPPGYEGTAVIGEHSLMALPEDVRADLPPLPEDANRLQILLFASPERPARVLAHHPAWDTPHTLTHAHTPPALGDLNELATLLHLRLAEPPEAEPRPSCLDLDTLHATSTEVFATGQPGLYTLSVQPTTGRLDVSRIYDVPSDLSAPGLLAFLSDTAKAVELPDIANTVREKLHANAFEGMLFHFTGSTLPEADIQALACLESSGLELDRPALDKALADTGERSHCTITALTNGHIYYSEHTPSRSTSHTASQHSAEVLSTYNGRTTRVLDPYANDEGHLDSTSVSPYIQHITAAFVSHLGPYDPSALPASRTVPVRPAEPLDLEDAHHACYTLANSGNQGVYLIYKDGTTVESVWSPTVLGQSPDLAQALNKLAQYAEHVTSPDALPETTLRSGSRFVGLAVFAYARAIRSDARAQITDSLGADPTPEDVTRALLSAPGSPLAMNVNLLTPDGDHYVHSHTRPDEDNPHGCFATHNTRTGAHLITDYNGTHARYTHHTPHEEMLIAPGVGLTELMARAAAALGALHNND